ncbi:MAG: SAM-dependent methyltransferase [Bacteroidales bacterium]
MSKSKGILYLIPTYLAGTNGPEDLPVKVIDVIHNLDCFIAEKIRTARRFLKSVGYPHPIDRVTFYDMGKHTDEEQQSSYIKPMLDGRNCGLLSEAGLPCLADPGNIVVREAHQHQIRVVPLAGPSSIIMALIASGLNGQNFSFHGYLPVNRGDRVKKIKELENESAQKGSTQIMMDTPFRSDQLFNSLIEVCRPETLLTVAVNISDTDKEFIRTLSVEQWKRSGLTIGKQPAVFCLQTMGYRKNKRR